MKLTERMIHWEEDLSRYFPLEITIFVRDSQKGNGEKIKQQILKNQEEAEKWNRIVKGKEKLFEEIFRLGIILDFDNIPTLLKNNEIVERLKKRIEQSKNPKSDSDHFWFVADGGAGYDDKAFVKELETILTGGEI